MKIYTKINLKIILQKKTIIKKLEENVKKNKN
jgi:hypothetical protein